MLALRYFNFFFIWNASKGTSIIVVFLLELLSIIFIGIYLTLSETYQPFLKLYKGKKWKISILSRFLSPKSQKSISEKIVIVLLDT